MTQTTFKYYCTYRNRDTGSTWRSSRRYPSMAALLSAMSGYLEKNPNTQVTFLTERSFTSVEAQQ